jgi:hypothetical protein
MLTENSSFRDGIQFAWDSTSIKLAEDCLRKYKYKLIDGWQPRRKSVHLLFGGWYATALEHYHKHVALGDSEDEALVKVIRAALVSTWTTALSPEGEAVSGPWVSDHPTKTRVNLIRTIVWYVDHFRNDPVEVYMKADGTPAVEFSFSFEIDNGITLSGHIDRLVKYSDSYYVMDQKTTGSTITTNYFEQFDPDTQMSLYTMAGQIIYDKPVKGVIIDAAQIAVGFTRFSRGFTFRDPAKLDEWYDSAIDTINRARHATEMDKFPMNPSSCHKYAGCDFRHACYRSPAVREQFLKADFERGERWDPLRRR